MEFRQHCAYNQTRVCLLGMDLVAGDFTHASLAEQFPRLLPNSGSGLWIVPFRGISDQIVGVQLDLIYLDEHCRVIGMVESFPTYQISHSTPSAASVLVLPTLTICISQTQPGDQLLVCPAVELTQRLQRLSNSVSEAESEKVQGSGLRVQAPAHGSGLTSPEAENQFASSHADSSETGVSEPQKDLKPSRGWLRRWLFPDPPDARRLKRVPPPGLVAYFWTGGEPHAFSIRNISASGLYIVTEERWYQGTVLRIALTKPDSDPLSEVRSIRLQAKVVRWGNDGVGLQFILQDPKEPAGEKPSAIEAMDGKQLDAFLNRYKSIDS
jgi:PilZ domain